MAPVLVLLQQYFSNIGFITIILVSIISLVIRRRRRGSPEKSPSPPPRPPGPRKLPVIGNLHQLICPLPHHRLRDLAQKHGPHLMGLQLGELPYVVVSSPEAAREVLKAHDLNFATRPWLLLSDIVFYGGRDIGLAPYGEHWRQMRKICVMELLSASRVASFPHVREAEASRLAAAVSAGGGSGGVVDLGRIVSSSTCRFTFRAAFGMMVNTEKEAKFSELIADIVDAAGGFKVANMFPSLKFLPYLTGYRSQLTRMHLSADAMLQDIIDEHRSRRRRSSSNGGAAEDLVDILLKLQEDETHELDIPLSTESIKAVILDLFLGGIDTTSTLVEWAMSELMRSPDAMQRAQEEARRIFRGKRNIDEECLDRLAYLDSVIQESLRLHPPVPLLLPKEARERAEVLGYEIPSGTRVIVNAWAIGRDSRYWKDADKFLPERFLGRSGYYNRSDFEFIPFGHGRRMCPGISFGLAIVKLTLTNLLYHFDWQLPAGTTPENLDMTECFGSGVRRKHSLCLIPVANKIAMP